MLRTILLRISLIALFVPAYITASPDAIQPRAGSNPIPRKDNFAKWPDFGEGEDWLYYVVNGNNGSISVNGPLPFDNSSAEITAAKELHFTQVYDADFDAEYPGQYNNIFMIGFQGYQPNTERDIVWNFDMKIEPDTYGSTGFVVETKDTFAPDGNVALPFNLFGVTYTGAGDFGAALRCLNTVDFAFVLLEPIPAVDPFDWNAYEIRFHLLDSETVLASLLVNDTQVCQTTLANYGETEIQIWLDNYKVSCDPRLNPECVSLDNRETPQGVFYDNIRAKARPIN